MKSAIVFILFGVMVVSLFVLGAKIIISHKLCNFFLVN